MEIGDTLHIKDANEMFASAKWKILGDPSVSIVSIVAPIKAATATAATAAAESETAAKGKEKTSEKTEKK
jgi:ribosomal protein L12E/L44/L45/RPP1/RPP2